MPGTEEPNNIGGFTKIKVLGKGSFGEVSLWKGEGKYFAIKKCTANLKDLPSDVAEKLKERWHSEINMMKNKVKCDSIVKALSVNQTFIEELSKYNVSGLPVLAMEYCEMGDLRQMLCKIENSNGLKEPECRSILRSLRNAVKTLHEINITHRDIKPENIIITNRDGKLVYKLTDLGYAKQICHTAENSCVGSPGYYAPEIITCPEYSKRVDYWSVGVIAFEIICGIRPFIPHQTIVKWMLAIKGKSSKVIAITENNKKQLIRHEKIFNENQISDMFKFLTENWLVLALEYDAKQRGSQFIRNEKAKNEPPQLVLKFYTELDKVVNAKILKMYSLTNYKFLSYIIDETTTMNELKRKIEISTFIPAEEIYFVIPIQSKVDQMTMDTKAIDFYVEDSDEIMLYVTQLNKICEKPSGPPVSAIVQDILEMKKDEKVESFYFKEFTRHVVYMLRKEQLHYVSLLNGLRNFALNLNDSIEKNQSNKEEMKNKTLIALTKVNAHVAAVSHTREKIEEKDLLERAGKYLYKWEHECNKIQEETQRFVDVYLRVVQRFESIFKRSKKILNSHLLQDTKTDYFEVDKYEKKYQLIRHLKEFDRLKDENEESRKVVYDCMTRRKTLLKNIEFQDLQTSLNEILVEYVKCYKIINDSQMYLNQHENEIQRVINEYHDEFWELQETLRQPLSSSQANSLNGSRPDIDALMSNEESNKNEFSLLENFNININGADSIVSCFGESNDTKCLIEENDQIIVAFEDQLTDFYQLIKNI